METRQILLQTAETLLRTKGVDAFSFADLAGAADIRKASVHYHFPSKSNLTNTVLSDYVDRFWSNLSEKAEHLSAHDQLEILAQIYGDAMSDGQSLCLCVALSVTPNSLDPAVSDAVTAFHIDVAEWIRQRLEPQDITTAQFILATLQGAQLVARSFGGRAAYDAIVERTMAQITTQKQRNPSWN